MHVLRFTSSADTGQILYFSSLEMNCNGYIAAELHPDYDKSFPFDSYQEAQSIKDFLEAQNPGEGVIEILPKVFHRMLIE